MTSTTDLTRLHAHEMAARLRSGEVSSHDLAVAHLDLAERQDHGLHAWLIDRPRAGARRGRCRGCPVRGRPRRGRVGRGPAAPAARRPDRAQGPRLRPGRPVHGRLADPGGLPVTVRRPHHRAAARRRRGHPGQDQHGRVRDGLVDGALRIRAYGEPVGARSRAGRQQRGLGGGRRGLPRSAVDRDGHRRLHPAAGGPDRDRRAQADVRSGQPLRDRGVRELARPDRAVRAGRPRRRRAAARRGRARRARLDVLARTRAGRPCWASRPATTKPRARCVASASVCPASTSSPAWSPASRPASARPSRRSRPPARSSRRSRSRTPTTASRRTTSSRRPRPRPTWPATTASATDRGAARAATSSPTTSRPGGRASGRRSSAGSCSGPTPCRPATTTRTT